VSLSQPPGIKLVGGEKGGMGEETLAGDFDAVVYADSLAVVEVLLGAFAEAFVVEVLEI
jgi:hypothetical protein